LIVLAGQAMFAPRPAGAFVNENAPHPGAPSQGARKQGLQAKQGLNGAPISCDAFAPTRPSFAFTRAHSRVARASTDQGRCVSASYPTRAHPGRGALGNVTNGAKPQPQQQEQQVRQRRALGDISNRAAPTTSASAWAKNDEGLPVEYLHAGDPSPLASFDFSGTARPEAVAGDVLEHRAPTFGATSCLSAACLPPLVLEEGPMPTCRDAHPSPRGLKAAQLGRRAGRHPCWPCPATSPPL